jgi:hypothetical protein
MMSPAGQTGLLILANLHMGETLLAARRRRRACGPPPPRSQLYPRRSSSVDEQHHFPVSGRISPITHPSTPLHPSDSIRFEQYTACIFDLRCLPRLLLQLPPVTHPQSIESRSLDHRMAVLGSTSLQTILISHLTLLNIPTEGMRDLPSELERNHPLNPKRTPCPEGEQPVC